MKTRVFEYPATLKSGRRAHVGVVSSGDLEMLLVPSNQPRARIEVRTSVEGFEKTWERILVRFFTVHDIAADITINDFGATPGVVLLRLQQVMEVSKTQ
ncbi:MAG: malonate decarboxylase subunit delta [Balneolaceae bacterium]